MVGRPGRPLHRLLRLLNGVLLVSGGPGDNAVTLLGQILHLLNTELHFCWWSDKSIDNFPLCSITFFTFCKDLKTKIDVLSSVGVHNILKNKYRKSHFTLK